MKKIHTLLAVLIGVNIGSVQVVSKPLTFLTKNTQLNSLLGTLKGRVKFAQTHTIDPSGNNAKEMPRLVSLREALFMFIPADVVAGRNITLQVIDKNGVASKSYTLDPPESLPKADKKGAVTVESPDVIYAENTYSVKLPWNLIAPGMQIVLNDGKGKTGRLSDIDVGAENEVIIQTIRIGMLTGPASHNDLEENVYLAADYFQKIPVSRLTVAHYTPVYLKKVVLSNGTVYDVRSNDFGDWHYGDMRENIAKNLIAMGIDNANFGINSCAGNAHWQAAYFSLYTVHIASGLYQNGVVPHGYSGGDGIATLSKTIDNEFSHELGHIFGMGHYEGGERWYRHSLNSGWGWDGLKNKFIANFFWDKTNAVLNLNDSTKYFSGIYQYNMDAMSDGDPSSLYSNYTLYTGYTQKRIQLNLEKSGIISQSSSTGYYLWDEKQQQMVERSESDRRKPVAFGVPVTTFVGFYDPEKTLSSYIYPALTGSYGYVYDQEKVSGGQCWAEVQYQSGAKEQFALAGFRHQFGHMNKFHFNVETSKHPISISVNCPQADMLAKYHSWLAIRLGTTRPLNWDNDKIAKAGSIFGGKKGYWRLKHSSGYGNFPSGTNSNWEWEFVAQESQLKSEFWALVASSPYDSMGIQQLAVRTVDAMMTPPAAAVTIGKENGYSQVHNLQALRSLKTCEMESQLLRSAHQAAFKEWNENDAKSNHNLPSELYVYRNPYTHTRDYFKLKETSYGFFPISQVSNHNWEYLGSSVVPCTH